MPTSSFSPIPILVALFLVCVITPIPAQPQAANPDFGRSLWSVSWGPGLTFPQIVSLDSNGDNIYGIDVITNAIARSRLFKFSSSGNDLTNSFLSMNDLRLDEVASAVVVDVANNNNVYVSNGTTIFRLANTGSLLYTFPQVFTLVNSIAVDSNGNIIVADYPGFDFIADISIISNSGSLLRLLALSVSDNPGFVQLALDRSNNIYYTSYHNTSCRIFRVLVLSPLVVLVLVVWFIVNIKLKVFG